MIVWIMTGVALLIPVIAVVVVMIDLPGVRQRQSNARFTDHHCPKCRYDLRAQVRRTDVDRVTCPECGHVVKTDAQSHRTRDGG